MRAVRDDSFPVRFRLGERHSRANLLHFDLGHDGASIVQTDQREGWLLMQNHNSRSRSRAEQVGEDQNPDDGAEQLLQEWRLQKDQRDYEETEKRDHRRGDVLIELPV